MKTILFKGSRKAYRKVFRPNFPRWAWCTDEERVEANNIISSLILSDKPCLIGRVGTTEGAVIMNYLSVKSREGILKKVIKYITDDIRLPWWDFPLLADNLCTFSGFFPNGNLQLLEKFAALYIECISIIDVCGRFEYYEKFLPYNQNCKMVQLEALYPFFVNEPWMKHLEGKKVLVIHPFVDTIRMQYENRRLLFEKEDYLPQFELKLLKAVQSLGGESNQFETWFDALDFMKSQIMQIDFDICIVGAGAYGLPLASFVKSLGKKAIHMGGGTQLLFGIKGKRWEQDYENPCYRNMFNDYWTYPSTNEKPAVADKVEGGCYW